MASILDEASIAISGMEEGIASYPLCDYIMQSLFLKMTGFQEQKLKCIYWDIATHNFDFRHSHFNKDKIHGECSTYSDKVNLYKELLSLLERKSMEYEAPTKSDRTEILKSTMEELKGLFSHPGIKGWSQKQYFHFFQLFNSLNDNCILFTSKDQKHKTMFRPCKECKQRKNAPEFSFCKIKGLKEFYDDHVYRHRNRCAHNSTSYQQNLPDFEAMDSDDYVLDNYYLRFAVLLIIDKIFILLYKKFLDLYDYEFTL